MCGNLLQDNSVLFFSFYRILSGSSSRMDGLCRRKDMKRRAMSQPAMEKFQQMQAAVPEI